MDPIQTTGGLVQGYALEDVRIYRGIPYARTKRFQKPQPYCWEGIFDATTGELDGYQRKAFVDDSHRFYSKEFHTPISYSYSEDFVTLSVVAPKDARNCPVLTFIHGGGFEIGHVADLPYGLSREYAKRGVILVSIGYRLNVFSLYRGGNYGLHDMTAAVEWIYDNAEAFGGDPHRITLMGQSAGAMSITDLLYSQRLKGKVFAAVTISGGGRIPRIVSPWTREQSQPFWDKVMARAGAATEEEMEALPPQQLWQAWSDVKEADTSLQAGQPAIDGEIIPDYPHKVFRARQELDVPILLGVTSQDFMPVVLYEVGLAWGKENARKGKQPIFAYFFDHPVPGDSYRCYHSCDLWYLFGQMEHSWRPFGEADRQLAARMMDYVANFVKTGNPNGQDLPQWHPLGPRQSGFRRFKGSAQGHISPWRCRLKVWNTMLFDKGPM